MNLHAENRFSITKELFFEGMLRVSRNSYGKYSLKAAGLFFCIWLVLLIITLLTGGSMGTVIFSLGVVLLVSFWICIWTPRSYAKKAWKKQQNTYGEAMKRITRFYDDHLEIRGDCPEKTVTYDNIKEIKESKNLILLVCYDKMGILLSQTGFTQGNVDIVRELIEKARA
jgi:hypothetical protein